jgi:hypothetical protein
LRTNSVFPSQKLHEAVINPAYSVYVSFQEGGRHEKFRRELIGLDLCPLDSLRRLIITPIHPNILVDVQSHTFVKKEVR